MLTPDERAEWIRRLRQRADDKAAKSPGTDISVRQATPDEMRRMREAREAHNRREQGNLPKPATWDKRDTPAKGDEIARIREERRLANRDGRSSLPRNDSLLTPDDLARRAEVLRKLSQAKQDR